MTKVIESIYNLIACKKKKCMILKKEKILTVNRKIILTFHYIIHNTQLKINMTILDLRRNKDM